MTRPKYQTRHIMLVGEMQKETAKILIDNAPMDAVHPIEFVIREAVKPRKPDQNALMWTGPLKDIAEQAWWNGKQYTAEVWHETYKRLYLPEEEAEGITKAGYKKWDYMPNGERVLVGSTTQLTVKGFAIYMEQLYADGAKMGVRFHTVDRMAA
jgi:hypothetical protein